MLLLFVWFVVYIFLYKKYKERSIIYIPIIFILNKISRSLISVNPGAISSIVLLEYTMLFFFIYISIVNLIKSKYSMNYLSKIIFIFIIYLTIIGLVNSTDKWLTFKATLAITTSFFVLVASYNYIPTGIDLLKIQRQLFIVLLLFMLNITILSIFKIGESLAGNNIKTYVAPFLHWGQFNIFEAQGISIITSLFFITKSIFTQYKKRSILLFAISIVILIIFLLSAKRTNVILIIFGFSFSSFLYYSFKSNKIGKLINSLLIIGFTYVLISPFFSEFVEKREAANDIEIITTKGRTQELSLYPEVIKSQTNHIAFMLIGKELFNSAGKFSVLNSEIGITEDRALHNDYSQLLYGTGLIGLFLYLLIILKLLRLSYKYRARVQTSPYNSIAIGTIVITLELVLGGYDGGILNSADRIIPFFTLGIYLSFLRFKTISDLKQVQTRKI
jgi:hypothetical protein